MEKYFLPTERGKPISRDIPLNKNVHNTIYDQIVEIMVVVPVIVREKNNVARVVPLSKGIFRVRPDSVFHCYKRPLQVLEVFYVT